MHEATLVQGLLNMAIKAVGDVIWEELQALMPLSPDALRKQREDGLAMLDKAALRLEAIRVLVAG